MKSDESRNAEELHPQQHERHLQEAETSLRDMLDSEKALYPGASNWALGEERLFEILFLRQELPLLPSHWDMAFRGVPMMDSIFQTSPEYPPIVFAHSDDFHASTALTRLIDVTLNARTKCQLGQRHKAPSLIKDTIESYIAWAAQDGGYQNLRYVPNIIVATIDESLDEDGTTVFMQQHMHALARLQRGFLRQPEDANFWDVGTRPARPFHGHLRSSRYARFSEQARLIWKYMVHDDHSEYGSQSTGENLSAVDESMTGEELADIVVDAQESLARDPSMDWHQHHEASNALYLERGVTSGSPSLASKSLNLDDSVLCSNPEQATQYRRRPPVVYGLFVLRTTVFLVTLDSAKGEGADVSFHVDLVLTEVSQSVWNALTIAIVVCLARDELMARVDDFEPLDLAEESDPDA